MHRKHLPKRILIMLMSVFMSLGHVSQPYVYAADAGTTQTAPVEDTENAEETEPESQPEDSGEDSGDESSTGESSAEGSGTESPSDDGGGGDTEDAAPEQENGGGNHSEDTDTGHGTPEKDDGADTGSPAAEQEKEKTPEEERSGKKQEEKKKSVSVDGAEEKKEEKKDKEDKEDKKDNKKPDESKGDRPEGEAEAEKHTGSNEDLLKGQSIISIPKVKYNFRFFTCDYDVKFTNGVSYVYEETDESSEKVGIIGRNTEVRVLIEKDGWSYIESGDVRGFMKAEDLFDDVAEPGPAETETEGNNGAVDNEEPEAADADEDVVWEEDEPEPAEDAAAEEPKENIPVAMKDTGEQELMDILRGESRSVIADGERKHTIEKIMEYVRSRDAGKKNCGEGGAAQTRNTEHKNTGAADFHEMDAHTAGADGSDRPVVGSGAEAGIFNAIDANFVSAKDVIAEGESRVLVPNCDNDAFAYYKGTSYGHVIEKAYAISTEDTVIREEPDFDGRCVGNADKDTAMFIIEDAGDWLFVESGDVRGFVYKAYVMVGKELEERVEKDKEGYPIAEQVVPTEENRAVYYSAKSIKEGNKENPVRKAIVELALSCVGNPYVWGGTSLTNGADCSGFVQTLYRQYGYKLPRVAESQAYYGTKIPVEDAEPGDLIFFAKNGYIYHVAMSIGDGNTVEAYSSGYGIITHSVSGRSTIWATRILD